MDFICKYTLTTKKGEAINIDTSISLTNAEMYQLFQTPAYRDLHTTPKEDIDLLTAHLRNAEQSFLSNRSDITYDDLLIATRNIDLYELLFDITCEFCNKVCDFAYVTGFDHWILNWKNEHRRQVLDKYLSYYHISESGLAKAITEENYSFINGVDKPLFCDDIDDFYETDLLGFGSKDGHISLSEITFDWSDEILDILKSLCVVVKKREQTEDEDPYGGGIYYVYTEN